MLWVVNEEEIVYVRVTITGVIAAGARTDLDDGGYTGLCGSPMRDLCTYAGVERFGTSRRRAS